MTITKYKGNFSPTITDVKEEQVIYTVPVGKVAKILLNTFPNNGVISTSMASAVANTGTYVSAFYPGSTAKLSLGEHSLGVNANSTGSGRKGFGVIGTANASADESKILDSSKTFCLIDNTSCSPFNSKSIILTEGETIKATAKAVNQIHNANVQYHFTVIEEDI